MKYLLMIFVSAFSFTSLTAVVTAEDITPVIGLLLQDETSAPLTDRSNVQCRLTLDSFSPNVGEDIPVNTEFTATYTYVISQRPLDVEVRISANVFTGSSGVVLGPVGGQLLVAIDDGEEAMTGQIQLSSTNTGVNQAQLLEELRASCLLYTIYDAEDEMNNPGPGIGSRVQFSTPGVEPVTQTVNWMLESLVP